MFSNLNVFEVDVMWSWCGCPGTWSRVTCCWKRGTTPSSHPVNRTMPDCCRLSRTRWGSVFSSEVGNNWLCIYTVTSMILLSCTADRLHCQSEDRSLWWTQSVICTENWHLYTQILRSTGSRQVVISGGVSLQYLRISMSFSASWPNKWKLFYFYLYLLCNVLNVMSWKSGRTCAVLTAATLREDWTLNTQAFTLWRVLLSETKH